MTEHTAALLAAEPVTIGSVTIRDNSGAWPLMTIGQDNERVALVDFQGKAKRGQGSTTPDPEGQANMRRLAVCWNVLHGIDTDELAEIAPTPDESAREEVSRLQELINAIERRIRKIEHG